MTPSWIRSRERHAVAAVALRDRDDEPEVRVDHPLLGRRSPRSIALRERDLLGRGEQLMAPELVHEQRERVGRPERRRVIRDGSARLPRLSPLRRDRRHDLDLARGELGPDRGDLLLVELTLEGECLSSASSTMPRFSAFSRERRQCQFRTSYSPIMVVIHAAQLWARAASRTLDTAAACDSALDACVRGVAARADVDHDLAPRGASRERRFRRCCAHARMHKVRMSLVQRVQLLSECCGRRRCFGEHGQTAPTTPPGF